MARPFRLIAFDLDGTLVDSRRDLADSANALLAAYGRPPLPESAIGGMVGDGAAALVGRVCAAAGLAHPSDALDRFLRLYDDRLLATTRAYDGIPRALEALSARAALGIVTNKPLAATRRILHGLHLDRFFEPDRVIGGDGPHPRKPDPAGLRWLMAACGVVPVDAVLVGDSVVDLRTARAAGVVLCIAQYGFGQDRFPGGALGPHDLVAARADCLGLVL